MRFGRLAVLTLIACISPLAPSHGSEVTDTRADRCPWLTSGNRDQSIVWVHFSPPVRGATLSPFTPWKTRIKSVLVESYERVIEQGDLGPAVVPGQLFASATSRLVSCPVRTRPPLRC